MIVEVANVSKAFSKAKKAKLAVDNVSFNIKKGETVGLVGESGCGKSTLSRLILGLLDCDSGSIQFKGEEITQLSSNKKRVMRRNMQILFQHPDSALNPRMRLIDSLIEPALLHRLYSKKEAIAHVTDLLDLVGLRTEVLNRYPHQLSGGQLQRAALIRILTLQPEFIVLDEPTSMLDVSVQALVMSRLQKVQKQFNLSYLFISHDLDLVRSVSDRILVMSRGRIVEEGTIDEIMNTPKHEYTKELVHAFSSFSS